MLVGSGQIATTRILFDYVSPGELATTAGCVAAGLLLLWRVAGRTEAIRERLTKLATGSVDDYSPDLAAGAVLTCLILVL